MYKAANLLDKMPKSLHERAKVMLQDIYLRMTDPIESAFATVRLRTVRAKDSGSRTACLTRVFKLARCDERHWHRLKGQESIPEVIGDVKSVDGIKEITA